MRYVEIEPTDNDVIDCFVEDCNLFAVFDLIGKCLVSNKKTK